MYIYIYVYIYIYIYISSNGYVRYSSHLCACVRACVRACVMNEITAWLSFKILVLRVRVYTGTIICKTLNVPFKTSRGTLIENHCSV